MVHKYSVSLYRMGNLDADDSRYYIQMETNLDDHSFSRLNFVIRYENLSIEQFNHINNQVRKYKGPQSNLLGKISLVMDDN